MLNILDDKHDKRGRHAISHDNTVSHPRPNNKTDTTHTRARGNGVPTYDNSAFSESHTL